MCQWNSRNSAGQYVLTHSLSCIPYCSFNLRIQLDVLAEVVLVGEVFKVSSDLFAGCVEAGPVRFRLEGICIDVGRPAFVSVEICDFFLPSSPHSHIACTSWISVLVPKIDSCLERSVVGE